MLRPHGLQHAMLPVSWSLLKFMSIESEMLSNHLILCPHPLLSPSPFAFSLSQHQGHFQWVSSFPLSQVAKVLELQFQHYPSNEYSGLISFKIEWFDLLAVQGTLKSLLQHHSSKASILQCSAQYWSFSFSISPFSEYSGLISFRIDWFDLLAVLGTHKSFL